MSRAQIQTALNEGIPFVIRTADGETYQVNERHQMAFGQTTVVVVGDDDIAHVLPLLTMTGISYLPQTNGSNGQAGS